MTPPYNVELVEVSTNSSPKARPVRLVADLAGTQDGVVGHGQLVALGFAEGWIRHELAVGRLHIIFRGAYAVGHKRVSWQGRYRAALLSCGPDAMLSHRSAVRWHNLRRWTGGDIHITVPGGGHEDRQEGIVVHRVRNIREVEKAVVDGLPVTSVARTLLDMAAVVRRDTLDRLLEAADDAGLLDVKACDAVCGRGRRGSKALKRALLLYRPVPSWTRSRLERYAYRLIEQEPDIENPSVNTWIGEHEVDLRIGNLVIEIDGGATHGTRAAKERDPRRDVEIQLAGCEIMRVTEHRLKFEPQGYVDDVRRFLSRAERTPARPGR